MRPMLTHRVCVLGLGVVERGSSGFWFSGVYVGSKLEDRVSSSGERKLQDMTMGFPSYVLWRALGLKMQVLKPSIPKSKARV